jgi:methylmalonyl-CoA mutase N-terminal domain/subunit
MGKIQRESIEDWKRTDLARDYHERGRRKNEFKTESEIELDDAYTSDYLDGIGFDESKDLGLPGQFPYTRGIFPGMFRADLWIMGQYAGFGAPTDTNERFKYLLEQGQTGLAIALDLPTQLGLDSDHELAWGEVGKAGVAISSLRDMEEIFDGIPLSRARQIFTTGNAISPVILAMFLILGKKQGIDAKDFKIVLQNDILKEFVARGTYIFPPNQSIRFNVDTVEYCTRYHSHFKPIVVCGSHMRQGGATATMELAFLLANAKAYIQAILSRGLDIDSFAPSMEVQLSVPMNLFEEIAKYRALRRMWAHMMRDQFGAKKPESQQAFIRVYTTGYTMTAQQPILNVIRVTIEALAAILGGCQSLSCSAMDEVLCLPTRKAAHVALMTQHIIAQESGVADVVDPLGGSYFIEGLTSRIEEEADKIIDKIEEKGGAESAISQGYYQRLSREAASRYQQEIEEGSRSIIGLNCFEDPEEEIQIESFTSDPDLYRRRLKGLKELRRNRDNQAVKKSLRRLKDEARSGDNTVPALIECLEEYVTIGEIFDILREVFGTFEEGFEHL